MLSKKTNLAIIESMKSTNNEEVTKHDADSSSGTSFQEITNLLRDPVIIRVVTVVDIASLSVLELLEYGLSRSDLRYAVTKGVISFVWSPPYTSSSEFYRPLEITEVANILVSDESYYNSLKSKVVLTKLGLFILDSIKGCETDERILDRAKERFNKSEFSTPTWPHK